MKAARLTVGGDRLVRMLANERAAWATAIHYAHRFAADTGRMVELVDVDTRAVLYTAVPPLTVKVVARAKVRRPTLPCWPPAPVAPAAERAA